MKISFLPTALATRGGGVARAASAPAPEARPEGFLDLLGEALVEPAPATRRKAPVTRRDAPRAAEPASALEAQTPAKAINLSSVSSSETRHAPGAIATTTAPPSQPLPLPSTPAGVDLAGGVLRSAAHLKVDAGVLGAVDLHLRVRDGAVHLRVEGDAAPLLEARSAELGGALASEGLRLGSIELPRPEGALHQDGTTAGQGEGRRQGWEEAASAREAVHRGGGPPRPGTKARSTHDGSIDVQA